MECVKCDLHIEYLERIINMQKNEISFLRSVISNNSQFCCNHNSSGQQQNIDNNIIKDIDVKYCIFDIIDSKVDTLDINFILSELNNKYPAKQHIINILAYFIIDDEYNMFYNRKNEVKYVDQENKVQLTNINDFSKTICLYIFDKLKPIIESKCTDVESCENNSDSDYEANNVRVENIMILKNEKMCTDLIKQIFKNNVI